MPRKYLYEYVEVRRYFQGVATMLVRITEFADQFPPLVLLRGVEYAIRRLDIVLEYFDDSGDCREESRELLQRLHLRAINRFAHNVGPRDWHVSGAAVQGYNVSWCALLTMGESWHNNHHAFPGSAKLGIEDGQWDPGWWVLKLLEKAGLVSNLVTEQSFQDRADLQPILAGGQ